MDILESPRRFQSSEAPKLRALALKFIHIRAANWEPCIVHCTITVRRWCAWSTNLSGRCVAPWITALIPLRHHVECILK
ncbi:unnamed protein product [Ixodes pacificus]